MIVPLDREKYTFCQTISHKVNNLNLFTTVFVNYYPPCVIMYYALSRPGSQSPVFTVLPITWLCSNSPRQDASTSMMWPNQVDVIFSNKATHHAVFWNIVNSTGILVTFDILTQFFNLAFYISWILEPSSMFLLILTLTAITPTCLQQHSCSGFQLEQNAAGRLLMRAREVETHTPILAFLHWASCKL